MRGVTQAVKELPAPVLVCDEPEESSEVSRSTAVSGWAYSPAGIREVSVWLDGRQMVGRVELGLERQDVAHDHPEWSDALRSGFRYRLEAVAAGEASAGSAELAVVVEDGEGRRTEVRRAVRVNESLFEPILVCDEPEEGSEVTLGTVVSGWAYSLAGIREISVWVDGQRMGEVEYGVLREDVARILPEWPNALRSGFHYRFETVPASAEAAELAVVAEDGEGRRTEVRHAVQVDESLLDPILVCEEPADGSEVTLGTVVSGWAYSPTGIREVSVWLDGQRVGQAEPGIGRPDVAEAHAEWSGAERSGFRYRFETVPASAEAAELAVVAEDGKGRRTEVRRAVRPAATLKCDEPTEGATVTRGTVVEGWAFSPAGIKEVSVWLDGRRVGRAEHGLERPDMAREYPNWLGASRSGFRYHFDAVPAPTGVTEFMLVAEDGEGRRAEVRRPVRAVEWTAKKPDEVYGRGLRLTDRHYRSYVGPSEDYDLLAAIQFTLLLAAGLRETHRMVDVGCGSLRAGRLLIPYLKPGHYFGVEPNRWLVEEGIKQELGDDIVRVKRPTFRFVEDFSLSAFGVDFDFAMAHSVFSHTYPDLALTGLRGIAEALAPQGKLFATFVDNFPEGVPNTEGSGWLYPGCVIYAWEEMQGLIEESGLVARRIDWIHPRQSWFVAAHPGAENEIDELSRHL